MLDLLRRDAEQQLIRLVDIKIDGGTQMRAQLDPATCAAYRDAKLAGAQFPPVVVFYDGETHWLGDGFHRTNADLQVANGDRSVRVPAIVHSGTRRDAVLYAAGANDAHGLRRSPADVRRAIEALLRDDEWSQWSDREIGRRCKADGKTVAAMRAALAEERPEVATTERRFIDGRGEQRVMRTAAIGATASAAHRQPVVDRAAGDAVADAWSGDAVVDALTVARLGKELVTDIGALITRLDAALVDITTAKQLTGDYGIGERADGYLRLLIRQLEELAKTL